MNIGLPEILSFAALIVSLFSMLYTRKQSEFARKEYINTYRSHLSESHSSYRKTLIEIQKKHKNGLSELSNHAGKTLNNIVHHFDQYDNSSHSERYLRHLLHESSEITFLTFQGQLAWQTAENISHRIFQTSFIEDQLNPINNFLGPNSFREKIKEKYLSNPNKHLEHDLINDIYFCNLVLEIKERINQLRMDDLMDHLQKEITLFNQLHNNLKSELSRSATILEELIYQGNKEHFSLRESYQLYKEMEKTQTILNTISYISIPENINKSLNGNYYYSISKSIHACTILHALQCIHSWGWNR